MLLSLSDLGPARPAPNGELRYRCPFCERDRARFKLYANPQKGVWHCFRCGAAGRLEGGNWGLSRMGQPLIADSQERRAPEEVLDRAYRLLLAALPLSDRHLLHLLTVRGLSPEAVAIAEYRTMPASPVRRELAAEAVARELSPDGVPGFWQQPDGSWTLTELPGLCIPVRDWAGRIRGIQVRRDRGEPRYMWLTSRGRPGGAPAKAVYHVTWNGQPQGRRVWVTEGPLKADVAARHLGEVFVAVPGVHTWRGAGVVEDLRTVGIREAVLAYDADQQSNPHVRRAAVEFASALQRAGLRVWVAVWPEAVAKGIDDLLLAGGEPLILSVREWLSVTGPGRQRASG